MEPEVKRPCLISKEVAEASEISLVPVPKILALTKQNDSTSPNILIMNDSQKFILVSPSLEQLYERYSCIVSQWEPIDGTLGPFQLLDDRNKQNSPEHILLNETIESLVQTLDIDNPRDNRVWDIVLLASDRFTALRNHVTDPVVMYKLHTRVKMEIGAYRDQKKVKRQQLINNAHKNVEELYELYPAVKKLVDENWWSHEVRTYRDTVLKIVQVMDITDIQDERIAHAVTFVMDQYPILRTQIQNHNLRRQFVNRIRQAILKPDYKLTDPARCERSDSPTHLEQVNLGICKPEKPIVVELVVDEVVNGNSELYSEDDVENNEMDRNAKTSIQTINELNEMNDNYF